MQVVHRQHQRPLGRQVERHPEQAVQGGEGDVAALAVRRVEHRRCRRRRARQRPLAVRGDGPLEEL
ncbi:MAG: hypothetical protein ACRDPC_14100, partial [Solirubrobacteraceae bacterium]